MSDETLLQEQSETGEADAPEGETIIEAEAVDKPDSEPETEKEPEAEEKPLTLEEQLAAAQAEAEDYKDRWLRSQADFVNARKRMEKQRIDTYGRASADVMQKLLPVLDDFERAMANVPEEINEDGWLEGVQLVQKKLFGILEGLNMAAIEAVGEPFDPNLHEAISQEPSDEYESGIVCRELQKGYKIGDRVIRPSLVVVAE